MARSGNAMAGVGGGLGKFTELRQRLMFVLGALIVYRIGCYIPVPGVNPEAMLQLMEQQKGTIVDMFNMFSGGALQRFSLFALNVVPYISASIVVQLMTQILPGLKAMSKEGESGRRKITQYTRYGTLGLALFQALGIALALEGSPGLVITPGFGFRSQMLKDSAEVLLYQLDKLDAGTIDIAALRAAKLIPASAKKVKIVKKGEVTKKFVLQGVLATAGAKAAIEAAGGKVGE